MKKIKYFLMLILNSFQKRKQNKIKKDQLKIKRIKNKLPFALGFIFNIHASFIDNNKAMLKAMNVIKTEAYKGLDNREKELKEQLNQMKNGVNVKNG